MSSASTPTIAPALLLLLLLRLLFLIIFLLFARPCSRYPYPYSYLCDMLHFAPSCPYRHPSPRPPLTLILIIFPFVVVVLVLVLILTISLSLLLSLSLSLSLSSAASYPYLSSSLPLPFSFSVAACYSYRNLSRHVRSSLADALAPELRAVYDSTAPSGSYKKNSEEVRHLVNPFGLTMVLPNIKQLSAFTRSV